jgi:hypothetical protein
MRSMRLSITWLLLLVSCGTAPAARSPMRERLGRFETTQLENRRPDVSGNCRLACGPDYWQRRGNQRGHRVPEGRLNRSPRLSAGHASTNHWRPRLFRPVLVVPRSQYSRCPEPFALRIQIGGGRSAIDFAPDLSRLVSTFGPPSFRRLEELRAVGATAFRINASHMSPRDVALQAVAVSRMSAPRPLHRGSAGGQDGVSDTSIAARVAEFAEVDDVPWMDDTFMRLSIDSGRSA